MDANQGSEEAVFEAAQRIENLAERAAYLDGACAGDPELRRRIDRLVEAAGEAEGFFGRNAGDLGGIAELARDAPVDAAQPADLDGPGSRVGRYKLLQRIGEGGFGTVYMAEQREPVRRRVALKIIKLGMDTRQVVARFEAERQALAMMDHPHIARVLDGGCTDTGRPYFVMELVKGEPITGFCDRDQLTTTQRLEMFVKVCQAIQHAHQKGIVHRDIKPGNILVALHDGVPVPKVIDFGIAKAMQHDLTDKTVFTQFEQFMGTPAYMSPEQAAMDSTDVDTRSDIYSLGVLLYELLTGVTPLAAKELTSGGREEMRRRIREIEPPRPSNRVNTMQNETRTAVARSRGTEPDKLTKMIRGDLDWIILKALDKDRNRRYETANGLALDVQRFLKDEPVTAVKPGVAYLARKFAKRHRAGLAAAATFVSLLAAGATVSTAQAIKAKREEAKARKAAFVAEIAQKNEAELRIAATEQWENAERSAYTFAATLIPADWEKGNYDRVRDALDQMAGYGDKSFEWYYWKRLVEFGTSAFPTYASGVRTFAVSPDGTKAALVMENNTVEVRSLPDGEHLATYTGHLNHVTEVEFSPDGARVASCGGIFFDGAVKVWDATTGAEVFSLGNGGDNRQLDATGSRPYALAFSPDGQFLATGSQDRVLRIWDAKTGELLQVLGREERRQHGWSWVRRAAFSADGRHVLFSAGSFLGVYDLQTGALTDTRGGDATHDAGLQVRDLIAWRNRTWVAFSDADGKSRLFDIADGRFGEPLREFGATGDLALSADGTRLVASRLGASQVFDVETSELLFTQAGGSYEAQFCAGRDRLVSSDGDRWMRVWEVDHDRAVRLRELGNELHAISKDGTRAVVARNPERRGELSVVDVTSGETICTMLEHAGPEQESMSRFGHIDGAAFSPDGELVASGGRGPWNGKGWELIVWNATSGEVLYRVETPNVEHYALHFSPDGRHLVAKPERESSMALWDAATGEVTKPIGGPDLDALVVAPGAGVAAGATGIAEIRIFDVESGEELRRWKAHEDMEFASMRFHSYEVMVLTEDGRFLFTGGGDRLVKKWDVGTGELLATFRGHQDSISGVQLSPDERRVISYAFDGTLRLWDADTGRELLLLNHPSLGRGWLWAVAMPEGKDEIVAGGHATGNVAVWRAASAGQVDGWLQASAADAERWERESDAVQRRRTESRELGQQRHDERVAHLERAPSEPLHARDWLVLGPVPVDGDTPGEMLDQEPVSGEAQLRPRGNERAKVGETEMSWRAVGQKTGFLDAGELFGETAAAEPGVAYAVTYIESDSVHEDVKLYLSLRGETKLYFNGDLVHPGGATAASPVVDLRRGTNVAVLKFPLGGETPWEGRMWLGYADRTQGSPTGIRLGLDPGD